MAARSYAAAPWIHPCWDSPVLRSARTTVAVAAAWTALLATGFIDADPVGR